MRATSGGDLWSDMSDVLLDKFLAEYSNLNEPIQIDVRNDVNWVNLSDRLTHSLHPYPARLIRHIPILFLNSSRYSKRNELVVDPFCGSGTVLLEAAAAGRRAVGADANPLARLISQVKVRPIAESELRRAITRTLARLPKTAPELPNVVNRSYWFADSVVQQLAKLRFSIDIEDDPHIRDFLRVCLSVAVRRGSLADPRISVPVKLRRDQYPAGHWLHAKSNARFDRSGTHDAIADFEAIGTENARRVGSLTANGIATCVVSVTSDDARAIKSQSDRRLRAGSAQLILTSPPYLGAQKYIRASSLSLGWLGETEERTLRELEDLTIGREHFPKARVNNIHTGVALADPLIEEVWTENPLRAHIAASYLCEMREALSECHRVLTNGGTLVMVTGSNRLCGRQFHTTRYLTEIASEIGFEVELELVDTIRSRGLMTRRNASAGVIESEAVTVLRKGAARPHE